jgi:UDP-3-O-[3-hydroxymyristoyl] glucosamine N-acyltransferase
MEIPLKTLVDRFPVVEIVGSSERTVTQVVSVDKKPNSTGDLTWVSDKNLDKVSGLSGIVVIVSPKIAKNMMSSDSTFLIVHNPRLYFLQVLSEYFSEKREPSISSRAIIADSAKIGRNVNIHPGVVIEEGCVIGDDSSIDCNSVIKNDTIIGKRVKIGANNTIGGVGFGYERREDGQYIVIPHVGNVVIEDDAEIGNNTAIDRAVLGSTVIRKNAKIDNLVHIAHGVEIGENSLVIANAMIAGSVTIGKNAWIAPSVSVLNKKRVGDNALIGMGAVVLRDVPDGKTVVGNPAKELLPKKEGL